jgi:hypothetical protein
MAFFNLDIKRRRTAVYSQQPELWNEMAEVSSSWTSELHGGKAIAIDGIGVLKRDLQGLPFFYPDETSSLLAYYSILPAVPFTLPDNRITHSPPEKAAVPIAKARSTFFSRSKLFGLLFLLLLLSTVWWLSTPHFDVPEIPNGRVNLKPGDYYDSGIDKVNQPVDTTDLSENNANINVAPKETVSDSIRVQQDPCYVVLGSFLNKENSLRLKHELVRRGLTVELIPYESFTRVSVMIQCKESEERLAAFRSNYNQEAWLLD